MVIKNLMEDKVITLTKDYLRETGKEVNTRLFNDMVVYTLNRTPTEYISSSRGLLHKTSHENKQITIDIGRTIHEAYTAVQRRDASYLNDEIDVINKSGFYAVYPIIIGNVFYAHNFARVEEGTITAYIGSQVAKSYNHNFQNPFIITKYSPGRFAFCFEPELVDSSETFIENITLKYDCENCMESTTVDVILELRPTFYNENTLPFLTTKEIENIYVFDD